MQRHTASAVEGKEKQDSRDPTRPIVWQENIINMFQFFFLLLLRCHSVNRCNLSAAALANHMQCMPSTHFKCIHISQFLKRITHTSYFRFILFFAAAVVDVFFFSLGRFACISYNTRHNAGAIWIWLKGSRDTFHSSTHAIYSCVVLCFFNYHLLSFPIYQRRRRRRCCWWWIIIYILSLFKRFLHTIFLTYFLTGIKTNWQKNTLATAHCAVHR